jgi:hypothetical protein
MYFPRCELSSGVAEVAEVGRRWGDRATSGSTQGMKAPSILFEGSLEHISFLRFSGVRQNKFLKPLAGVNFSGIKIAP